MKEPQQSMSQLLGVALGTVGKLWQVSDLSAAAGICTGHWAESLIALYGSCSTHAAIAGN